MFCLFASSRAQNLDSLLFFSLIEPPDSFYVNRRQLWFIRTMTPMGRTQTVSQEFFMLNPAGGIRQIAHQGFDSATFFRPAMSEEGIYQWDYAAHPGPLVVHPSSSARWSINGPRHLIYDITIPAIEQIHLTHGLGSGKPSLVFAEVEVSEILDTSLSTTTLVSEDVMLQNMFHPVPSRISSYISSIDLLPLQADSVRQISVSINVADRATNSSDTVQYSGLVLWLNTPTVVDVSDPTGTIHVRLTSPAAPPGTAFVILKGTDTALARVNKNSELPVGHLSVPMHFQVGESFIGNVPELSQMMIAPPYQEDSSLVNITSTYIVLPERFQSDARHLLTITYDSELARATVLSSGIPPEEYDERNIGIYAFDHLISKWLFVGGEGRNGSVEFLTTQFGTLEASYNSSHVFYPDQARLLQNFPNPFNTSTIITYDLPSVTQTTIKIYDILGREVSLLFDAIQDPGLHTVTWDAVGRASGVYIGVLSVAGKSSVKKMLLIR